MALAPRTVQNIPGAFEAGSDHGFASGFDDARAHEEVLAAELGVAHALGIPLKIVCLGADLLRDFGVAGFEGAERAHELFDFPLVQQALLVESSSSPFAGLHGWGTVGAPTPTDADGRGKDRQSAGRRESAGRPDSKSIPPRRPSPPGGGRGSSPVVQASR